MRADLNAVKIYLNTVKIEGRNMPAKKSKYHHGDLRAALIKAADDLIAAGGIETFSLRAAAQRAGVSPSGPGASLRQHEGIAD